MTESHEQTDWPCLTSTAEMKSHVPMIQGDLRHEVAHGYATNIPLEHRDNSRLPRSSYTYSQPSHPSASGYLTQPHGVPKVISDPKLLPNTAPVLPNARQNVFFPNPLYHGYATNVPPEYRDHPRLPPSSYMYDQPSHPPASGYLTQPHGIPRAILEPELLPSTADVSMGGGPPSVGMNPGVERYDAYQHSLWSPQPQQQLFTVGNPSNSYPLTIPTSTTPNQSTVYPHTNTHKYVNLSPASTPMFTAATFSDNSGLASHQSPAHSTLLQVPSTCKISHGNVSLSQTIPRRKQYSDSQLEKQIQVLNLETTTKVARVPQLPMSSHPLHYPPVTSSVPKFFVSTQRRDLEPIQLQGKAMRTNLLSFLHVHLYSYYLHVTIIGYVWA